MLPRHFAILYLCIASLFYSLNASAQKPYSISGVLLDSANTTVPGATIMVSRLPKKTLAGFAFSDQEGAFKIALDSAGSFEVKVSYIGYGTFARDISIVEKGDLNLGSIVLSENVHALQGVTVEGRFKPIVVRNDTIEYDADSFHAGEGATVEDLLKRLPGITVEEDGTIKAQGEEVGKVLVDGKEFFDDDPKIATRNIPADVVDKVQVFDDASDFTKFTGIKDGEEEKTINLSIKEGKNKGTFGELKAEYGAGENYNTGASVNRFSERMQLSLLANTNNISEQAFSVQDYLKFSGAMEGIMNGEIDLSELPVNLLRQRGITSSNSGGVNFNYELGKRSELRSNYFYDRSLNTTIGNSTIGNLVSGGSYLNTGTSNELNELSNHRVKMSLEHAFTKKQILTLRLGGMRSDPFINSYSNSLLTLNDTVSNHSNTSSYTSTGIDRWNGQLVYRHKFAKAGRFFSSDISLNGERKDGRGGLLSHFGGILPDTLHQQQISSGKEQGYSAALKYVEPVGPAHYLYVNARRDHSSRDNTKLFYDGEQVLESNDQFSNGFDRELFRNVFGLKFQVSKSKFLYSLGADAQMTELDNRDLLDNGHFQSSYWSLLPNAMLSWKRTTASTLEARYSTRIQVPNMQQLQPVLDNSDPLNLYQGDPELSPEYEHRLNLRYNNFNAFYFRSFFVGMRASFVDHAITDRETISPELVRMRTPVNSDPEWEMQAYYDYGSPFNNMNFKFRLNGDFGSEQRNLLVNQQADRLTATRLDQQLRLENKKKKVLDWTIGTRLKASLVSYDVNTPFDQDLVNIDFFANVNVKFMKHWKLELNSKQRQYLSNAFIDKTELFFLHGKLSRSFLDNSLHAYVRGINLFDETLAVERQAYGSSYSEVHTDRLGRLILFGVSYKIRSFGK